MQPGPIRLRTPADLLVPVGPAYPCPQWLQMQQKLLSTVREFVEHPRSTQAARLQMLAHAVLPLAQVQILMGLHPDTAVEHATEILEANFLPAALRDTPELLEWFAQ